MISRNHPVKLIFIRKKKFKEVIFYRIRIIIFTDSSERLNGIRIVGQPILVIKKDIKCEL